MIMNVDGIRGEGGLVVRIRQSSSCRYVASRLKESGETTEGGEENTGGGVGVSTVSGGSGSGGLDGGGGSRHG